MENIRRHEADKILEVTNSYIERGIEQGIEIVAKEMLRDGFTVEKAMQLTKLERTKLEELKQNLSVNK